MRHFPFPIDFFLVFIISISSPVCFLSCAFPLVFFFFSLPFTSLSFPPRFVKFLFSLLQFILVFSLLVTPLCCVFPFSQDSHVSFLNLLVEIVVYHSCIFLSLRSFPIDLIITFYLIFFLLVFSFLFTTPCIIFHLLRTIYFPFYPSFSFFSFSFSIFVALTLAALSFSARRDSILLFPWLLASFSLINMSRALTLMLLYSLAYIFYALYSPSSFSQMKIPAE